MMIISHGKTLFFSMQHVNYFVATTKMYRTGYNHASYRVCMRCVGVQPLSREIARSIVVLELLVLDLESYHIW